MSLITHNRARRCPSGSRRVKGTNTCLVGSMGLKFPNPKRRVAKRKVVHAVPVTQAMPNPFAKAMPMGHATPIAYDLGLPTTMPYAQMPRLMPLAYAKMPPIKRKPAAKKRNKREKLPQRIEELD